MTEKRPLFRPEAVRHHAMARTDRRVLDLREGRTVWTFRAILLAVVAAVALAFAIPVQQTAHGLAVVGPSGRDALVAARVVGGEVGAPVTLHVGGRDIAGRVAHYDAGFAVTLDEPATPGATGTATVRLGRRSVAALLLGRR
jgi:hypothetical protein